MEHEARGAALQTVTKHPATRMSLGRFVLRQGLSPQNSMERLGFWSNLAAPNRPSLQRSRTKVGSSCAAAAACTCPTMCLIVKDKNWRFLTLKQPSFVSSVRVRGGIPFHCL
jgi:hypothetical protein